MFMVLQRTLALCGIALVLLGVGCAPRTSTLPSGEQTILDQKLKLSVSMPTSWSSARFNTLYKNSKMPSGYSYITGGINFGLGPKNQKGELRVVLHVVGVPKASVADFEKGKYPASAERVLETADYIIYSAVLDSKDGDVANVVKSLTVGK